MLRRIFSCLAALTLVSAGLALLSITPAAGGGAPAITVDTTMDDGNLDACTGVPDDCSLRGAMAGFANANHDDGVTIDITVPAGDYVLDQEISLCSRPTSSCTGPASTTRSSRSRASRPSASSV